MNSDALLRLYPEVGAGGFSRVDGTVEFYQRLSSLLRPEMTVLNFGAGRGQFLADGSVHRRNLQMLRGRVQRVLGVDVDDAVLQNPSLDEAHVVVDGQSLPFADESIDLILADWVFEHIRSPGWTSQELNRVLRPGGWLCSRTPNKRGYIGLAARAVPNRLHARALTRLQPAKQAEDTFPTAYKMNTRRELQRLFDSSRYEDYSYLMDSEPAYFGNSLVAWRAAKVLLSLTPAPFKSVHFLFMRKR